MEMYGDVSEEYDPKTWRHIEVVKPTLNSRLSYALFAEHPRTYTWYCIKAEDIVGVADPKDMIRIVTSKSGEAETIISRRCDVKAQWFVDEASKVGVSYSTMWKQRTRRGETIKRGQSLLSSGKLKFTSGADLFFSQLEEARWNEKADGKIVDEHLLPYIDCFTILCDKLPKPDPERVPLPYQEWLRRENDKRRLAQYKATQRAKKKKQIRWGKKAR